MAQYHNIKITSFTDAPGGGDFTLSASCRGAV